MPTLPLDGPPSIVQHPAPRLSHPIIPPAFPTGPAPFRFLKSAAASNLPLVAVTGGLDHLGSHIVARLLATGHFVRALVPSHADSAFLAALPGASLRLQLIPLRDPSAEDARPTLLLAFQGASAVVHAPAFSQLTHPTPHAARRVVSALRLALDCAAAPGNSVRTFVYLSSHATVYDPALSRKSCSDELSSDDWFDVTRPARRFTHPFAYAHTVAELRLWARVGRANLPFNVVSLIPSQILGPILSSRHVPATPSMAFVAAAAQGLLSSVPDVPFSPVDVRDVAIAVAVLVSSSRITGRILLNAESLSSLQLLRSAATLLPFFPWPRQTTRRLSFFRRSLRVNQPDSAAQSELVDVLKRAEFLAKDRRATRYAFSQQRAHRDIGLTFRPVDQTLRDTVESLQQFHVLPIIPQHSLPSQSLSQSSSANNPRRYSASFTSWSPNLSDRTYPSSRRKSIK